MPHHASPRRAALSGSRKTRFARPVTSVAAVVAVIGAGLVVAATPAQAATTLNVNTTADIPTSQGACGNSGITTAPSPLSLREATCLANNLGGTVTINVPAGHYVLTSGELAPGAASGQNVTIVGAGSASTLIDGNNTNRVFDIDAASVGGVSATISGVTIENGRDSTFGGAGILDGSLTALPADDLNVSNTVFSSNTALGAAQPGGALAMAGGNLSVTNSTFVSNSAQVYGSAIYYEVSGSLAQTLSVTGSTFSSNTVTDTGTAGSSGGALGIFGVNASYTVSGNRFTGNSVSSATGQQARGGAIYQPSGSLTATSNTFTGNSTTGTAALGSAIYSSGTATLQYNRITGNTGAGTVATTSTLNAPDNWWGCNAGANQTGCDTTSGTVNSLASYLKLVATASPAHVIGPNGAATITASLTTDSLGATVGGSNLTGAFDTLPVSFADPPGDATVTGSAGAHTVAMSSGQASIDYHSNTTVGPDNDSVTLDNATATAVLEVDEPPAITSANSAHFDVGSAGSFTVTTTGYPNAAISHTGTLPTGLAFTDNGNGTATINGTPTGGGGSFPISLTANNGYAPNATQTLTITVGQPPAFTSSTTATFKIGTAGSFAVTTSGIPTVSTITETGSLPAGLSYTDNGNGTASIGGTPTGVGGTYPVTLTATNGVTPDATQNLTIQVNEAPAITLNPSDQTVNPGASVTFNATASGVPSPTVQWQRSTDGGASFTNVGGATSASYTFTTAAGDDGNQYRAVFTNVAGSATTTAATLSVGTAPAFTSADNTSFVIGQAGSFTVTTTGVPSATLSNTGAAFPAWLTLTGNGDGTGALSGTPPAGSAGAYSFTLQAANGFSPSASQNFTLFVDQSPVITSADHASFTVGSSNTFTVTTTAGYPTATTITKTGTLPSGVTLHDNGDGTATLSGNPAAGTGGSYPITITADATGGLAAPATQTFTLTVNEPPQITSADHATFAVGSAGSFTVTTTAGNPTSTTISRTGTLPAGVSFTDNGNGTATIAGTPNAGAGGVYVVSLTASNGVAPDATQSFTLTVNEPPHISSADHATFAVGTSGAFTVTTTPGQPSAVTITETGALPGGVTFTDNGDGTAVLGGVPTAGGVYPITVTASNGVLPNSTQSFTLTVQDVPVITSADHTTFAVGSAGSFTVTTTPGTPASTTLTESGALPSGVTFTDNGDGTATLAGTPAAGTGGSYALTITAANGVLPSPVQNFTLVVTDVPAITSVDHAGFTVGAAGSFTVTSQAGYPTATTLTETGALPSGVTFTDNGDGTATLGGTPADGSAGSYPLTLTATNSVGSGTQAFTLTVALVRQTITFTTTPPAPAVVGQTYDVAATGGASGHAVTLAIDATSTAVCTLTGTTVRFDHPGSCVIDAAQAGDGTYAAATASQTIAVTKAATTTTIAVHAHTVTATVAPVAPGAGTPTGTVDVAVAGTPVGTATLVNGTATLTYTVPPGAVRSVSVVYSGDADFLSSSASLARHDPHITATVTSSVPRSRYGWYRVPVTITFQCSTDGSPLTGSCPAAVTLSGSAAGQSVSRTITADDGGVATVVVSGINIDRVAPSVHISGVRAGGVYAGSAPTIHCIGADSLSGLASCRLTSRNRGDRITTSATATDRAGNTRTVSVTYTVQHLYLAGARYRDGAFDVRAGHTYTLVVLTASRSRPRFYDAAPLGRRPGPAGPYLHAAGTSGGLHRWVLAVRIDHGLGRYPVWAFGVKIGSSMQLVPFRPV